MSSGKSGEFHTRLDPFEYRVYRCLADQNVRGMKVLLACSGGLDSVAMVACLAAIQSKLNLSLMTASIHHGKSQRDTNQGEYRDQAVQSVSRLSASLGLAFESERYHGEADGLRSEAALRSFRLKALQSIAARNDCDLIAVAHHADDLLETRLLRLIRGTGPQGLRSMRVRRGVWLRPFLSERRIEIEAYAARKGLGWLNDPSNLELRPLRNWIRHFWLPELERKRQGANQSLARSLSLLAELSDETGRTAEPAHDRARENVETDRIEVLTIDRASYLRLGIGERRRSLAGLLLQLGSRDFTRAHIEEIRKRIEANGSIRGFSLLHCEWSVNAGQITIRRGSALATDATK